MSIFRQLLKEEEEEEGEEEEEEEEGEGSKIVYSTLLYLGSFHNHYNYITIVGLH